MSRPHAAEKIVQLGGKGADPVGFGRLHPRSRRHRSGKDQLGQNPQDPTRFAWPDRGICRKPYPNASFPMGGGGGGGGALGKTPWGVPCDNGPALRDAERTARRGWPRCLSPMAAARYRKGRNMPTEPRRRAHLQGGEAALCARKASNAGGVAVSGLEMSQNSERALLWKEDESCSRMLKGHHVGHPQFLQSATAPLRAMAISTM